MIHHRSEPDGLAKATGRYSLIVLFMTNLPMPRLDSSEHDIAVAWSYFHPTQSLPAFFFTMTSIW